MIRYAVPLTLLPLLSIACGDDTSPASPDATTGAGASNVGGQGVGATGGAGATGVGGAGAVGGDGGAGTGGTGGNPPDCHATLGPEDALRRVVIARPYDDQGGQSPDYEILELDTDGTLTATGTIFSMGRAGEGEIAFTPDGQIGIAVDDNGNLGVFRLDADGQPEVVHPAFNGSFYANRVWIAPTGDRALVLDLNFPANGGGIYGVSIACDGTLTDEGLLATTKLARRMTPLHDGSGLAVLAASTFETSPLGADAHLIDLADLSSLGSADAFGDDDAIVAALDVTHDGAFALLGDNSGFSSVPNRVAVVSVGNPGLAPVQTLPNVEDPVDIVTSPFDDAAIVVSAFGDAIFELAYDPSAGTPFTMLGELDYVGGGPLLPVDAVMIERGALRGHVLVTEVSAVRQLQFAAGGIADEGRVEFGEGLEQLVGAIGVQP